MKLKKLLIVSFITSALSFSVQAEQPDSLERAVKQYNEVNDKIAKQRGFLVRYPNKQGDQYDKRVVDSLIVITNNAFLTEQERANATQAYVEPIKQVIASHKDKIKQISAKAKQTSPSDAQVLSELNAELSALNQELADKLTLTLQHLASQSNAPVVFPLNQVNKQQKNMAELTVLNTQQTELADQLGVGRTFDEEVTKLANTILLKDMDLELEANGIKDYLLEVAETLQQQDDMLKAMIYGIVNNAFNLKDGMDRLSAPILRNIFDINQHSAAIETNKRMLAAHNARLNRFDVRLNQLDKKLERGLATQAALAGLFQPYNVGKTNITAAIGGYKAQTAVAVGIGHRFNQKVAAKAAVAFNPGQGNLSYNAGVNYEF